jgi:CheY-like chemotaxis protein
MHADPGFAGRRLLIVDDNATNRRILSRQAQSWGLIPRAMASGAEALASLDAGDPFDAAIIDVQMPDMDGYTLAAEIRKRRPPDRLPIVALTSIRDNTRSFQDRAVSQVLTKPAKSALLHAALHALFQPTPPTTAVAPAPLVKTSKLAERYPLRILLAEDIAINQRVALLLLENLGYQADVASDGLEALAAVASKPFDVILMDVQMPEMDGLTCARHIRADYPEASARPWIIAMTANALEGDRQMCIDAGMDDYISKPISGRSIADALTRAAERLGLPRKSGHQSHLI